MKRISVITLILVSFILYAADVELFLHNNVTSIIHVNYERLSDPEILAKLNVMSEKDTGEVSEEKKTDKRELFRDYQDYTGFRPEEDLQHLYILIDKSVIVDKKNVSLVFIGEFDIQKSIKFFTQKMNDRKFSKQKYSGKDLYVAPDGYTFTFFDKNTLILSDNTYMRFMLNNFNQRDSETGKWENRLTDRLALVKGHQISGIINISENVRKAVKSKLKGAAGDFSDVSYITLGADVAPDIDIRFDIENSSSEKADELSNKINSFKIAGLIYGAKFKMADIVQNIQIDSVGRKTVVKAFLNYSDLERIKELSEQLKSHKKK